MRDLYCFLKSDCQGIIKSKGYHLIITSQLIMWRDKKLLWRMLLVGVTILSLILTPVLVFIIQDVQFNDPVVILLIFFDVLSVFDFWSLWQYSGMLCMLSLSPLYLVPILKAVGLHGRTVAWFNVPRMLCIFRLMSVFDGSWVSSSSTKSVANEAVNRIYKTMLWASLFVSIMACIWFAIGFSNFEAGNLSWLHVDKVIEVDNKLSRYVRSLHFVFQTLFTIGFGDIYPVANNEIVFTLFLIVSASLFLAFIISAITSLLSNKDVVEKRFRGEMDMLRRYLALRSVSVVIQDSIKLYFDFLYSKQYGMDEERLLSILPAGLKIDMKMSLAAQLKSVPFFKLQSEEFLVMCLQRMTFRTYFPGSYIFQQDDRPRELILIRNGRVDIINGNAKNALFSLVAGDYTGDFQLVFGTAAEMSARAAAFTETMVLSYEVFTDVAAATASAEPELMVASKWIEVRCTCLYILSLHWFLVTVPYSRP